MDVAPTILRDGVSVAKAINLEDQFADMGARLIKSAAIKTVNDVGDGTTLTTILTQTITAEAMKAIAAGSNPMKIKAEIEVAATRNLAELKKIAKPVKSKEETTQVATISASDETIGTLVAQSIEKVGQDGVITVEEGQTAETTVEYKQGMQVSRGYYSPYFVTDQKRSEVVIEEPYILLTDKLLNTSQELIPFLQKLAAAKVKNLVIFAGEVVEEALATLVVNKLKGVFNVVAVQSPAFGTQRIEELNDISYFVGGHPVLLDEGRELEGVEIEELGRASRVIVDRDKTVILNGWGSSQGVKRRIADLKDQMAIPNSPYDKDIKEQRLANLAGQVAVITVGGSTEVEMKEKKERVIDAIAATKAAVEEGIVAGGEITLLNLALKGAVSPDNELSIGSRIFTLALKAPFKKLMENSGLDYAEALLKLSGKKYPYGIDVISGEVKDMLAAGIIDPLKVLRCAIENAVSVAGMALTTNTLITEVIKDE
jgi:chaperonin GroEL